MSDEVVVKEEVLPVGINELQEALVAGIALGVKLSKLAKDGIDLSDGAALLADAELKDLIIKAASGADKIPAEIKDLSLSEGLQLAAVLIPEIVNRLK